MKVIIDNESWDEKRCWNWILNECSKSIQPDYSFYVSQESWDLLQKSIEEEMCVCQKSK